MSINLTCDRCEKETNELKLSNIYIRYFPHHTVEHTEGMELCPECYGKFCALVEAWFDEVE